MAHNAALLNELAQCRAELAHRSVLAAEVTGSQLEGTGDSLGPAGGDAEAGADAPAGAAWTQGWESVQLRTQRPRNSAGGACGSSSPDAAAARSGSSSLLAPQPERCTTPDMELGTRSSAPSPSLGDGSEQPTNRQDACLAVSEDQAAVAGTFSTSSSSSLMSPSGSSSGSGGGRGDGDGGGNSSVPHRAAECAGFSAPTSFRELQRLTRQLSAAPANMEVAALHAAALRRQVTRMQLRGMPVAAATHPPEVSRAQHAETPADGLWPHPVLCAGSAACASAVPAPSADRTAEAGAGSEAADELAELAAAVGMLSAELAEAAGAKCTSAMLLSSLLADVAVAPKAMAPLHGANVCDSPTADAAAPPVVASPAVLGPCGGLSRTQRQVQALSTGLQLSSAAELAAARASATLAKRVLELQRDLAAAFEGAEEAAAAGATGGGAAGGSHSSGSVCTDSGSVSGGGHSQQQQSVQHAAAAAAAPQLKFTVGALAAAAPTGLPTIDEAAALCSPAGPPHSRAGKGGSPGVHESFAFASPAGAGACSDASASVSLNGLWSATSKPGVGSGSEQLEDSLAETPQHGGSLSPGLSAPAWLQHLDSRSEAATQTSPSMSAAGSLAQQQMEAGKGAGGSELPQQQRVQQLEGRLLLLQQQLQEAEARSRLAVAARDRLQGELTAVQQRPAAGSAHQRTAGGSSSAAAAQPPVPAASTAADCSPAHLPHSTAHGKQLRSLQEQVLRQAARIEQLQLALSAASAASTVAPVPFTSGGIGSAAGGYATPSSGSLASGSHASTPAKSPPRTGGSGPLLTALLPPVRLQLPLSPRSLAGSPQPSSPLPSHPRQLQPLGADQDTRQRQQQQQQHGDCAPTPAQVPPSSPAPDNRPVWGVDDAHQQRDGQLQQPSAASTPKQPRLASGTLASAAGPLAFQGWAAGCSSAPEPPGAAGILSPLQPAACSSPQPASARTTPMLTPRSTRPSQPGSTPRSPGCGPPWGRT